MELLAALAEIPTSTSTAPSDDFIAFLTRIESAEPCLETYGEDDMGANWGHYQFTAEGLTCTKVLDSWDSVGGPVHVLRLIAAALRTSRVARTLCQDLAPQPSFLADAYLQNIVERLWTLTPTANKVQYYFHLILNF